ncbi:MAG: helix-turn-helix transcriptional regulator [Bacteroidota bacterium]
MGHHKYLFSLPSGTGISLPFDFMIGKNLIRFNDIYFASYTWNTPKHVHSSSEGVLFIDGDGIYRCYPDDIFSTEKEITSAFTPGTVLNVAPGNLHSYNIRKEVFLVYWNWEVHFYDSPSGLPPLVHSPGEDDNLIVLAARIFNTAAKKSSYFKEDLLKSQLQYFLTWIFSRLYGGYFQSISNNDSIGDAFNIYRSDLPEKIFTFIHNNFHLDLSLDLLSKYFHKSPRQIKRLLKQLNPPICLSKELKRLRINTARQLLELNPNMKLGEIAARCGYHDEYYFGKVFKEAIGISPGRYRKKLNFSPHDFDTRANK